MDTPKVGLVEDDGAKHVGKGGMHMYLSEFNVPVRTDPDVTFSPAMKRAAWDLMCPDKK